MSHDPVTCAMFDDAVEELAVGLIAEPHRTDLVAHAARCPRCQSALDGLVPVVDRLLLQAPEAEPPGGFESRALARLGTSPATLRRSDRQRWIAAAAAVILLIGAGIAARSALGSNDTPASATVDVMASGSIVAGTAYVGTVQLVETPAPHVLIAVSKPRGGSGQRTCELQRADGTWVAVGSWDLADIASGVWATGIDASLLSSRAMRITLDDGTVVATASLS